MAFHLMIFNSIINMKNWKYVIIYVDDMLCNEIPSRIKLFLESNFQI